MNGWVGLGNGWMGGWVGVQKLIMGFLYIFMKYLHGNFLKKRSTIYHSCEVRVCVCVYVSVLVRCRV